jgi:uncharacterized protein YdhG (YjbR/CyaY superfamily)
MKASASGSKTPKADKVDVDTYIAAAPPAVRPMLVELRQTIRAAAPDSLEKISYGMPTYEFRGRLASFAGYEHHAALYGVVHEDRPVDEEARAYLVNRSTLRFPTGRPLPVALVRRVVAARVKENRATHPA